MSKIFDERKCVVCGCTDDRACEDGCSWVAMDPPVCSTCIEWFLFAQAWKLLLMHASLYDAELTELMRFHATMARTELATLRKTIPTFKQIRLINSRTDRWAKQQEKWAAEWALGKRKRGGL